MLFFSGGAPIVFGINYVGGGGGGGGLCSPACNFVRDLRE